MNPSLTILIILTLGLSLSTFISWRISVGLKSKIQKDTVELLAMDRAAQYFDSHRPWPDDHTVDDSDEYDSYNDDESRRRI